jgi:hypothetical protein
VAVSEGILRASCQAEVACILAAFLIIDQDFATESPIKNADSPLPRIGGFTYMRVTAKAVIIGFVDGSLVIHKTRTGAVPNG